MPTLHVRNSTTFVERGARKPWVRIAGTYVGGGNEQFSSVAVPFTLAGNTTTTGTTLTIRTVGGASVRVKVSTSPTLNTNPIYSTAVAPGSLGESKHVITGLTPNTEYYYQPEIDGLLSNLNAPGRFRTFATSGTFNLALGSCCESGSNPIVFAHMASRKPDVFVHTGDMHYANLESTTLTTHAAAFEGHLQLSNPRQLYANTSLAYVWSDHDSGPNNNYLGMTPRGTAGAQALYRRFFPSPTLPATGTSNQGIYHTWNLTNRVRFLMTDGRSYRSNMAATDDANKTMLGAEQKQWFKDTVSAAPVGTLFFFVNELWDWDTFGGVAGADGWNGYMTEANELKDFINVQKARGLYFYFIGGDNHKVGFDNGTNGLAGVPRAIASALDKSGSELTRPITSGWFPQGASAGSRVQQYGWMQITDPGTGPIRVKFSAHGNTGNVIVGEHVVTFGSGATTTLTRTPTADTFTVSTAPDTVHESVAKLGSDSVARTYMKFDLSGVTGTVVSAKLIMRVINTATADTQTVSTSTEDWVESTMTWNNQPALATPSIGSLVGTKAIGSDSTFNLISSAIQSQLGGDICLAISQTGTDGVEYGDRNSANPPRLVLEMA